MTSWLEHALLQSGYLDLIPLSSCKCNKQTILFIGMHIAQLAFDEWSTAYREVCKIHWTRTGCLHCWQPRLTDHTEI